MVRSSENSPQASSRLHGIFNTKRTRYETKDRGPSLSIYLSVYSAVSRIACSRFLLSLSLCHLEKGELRKKAEFKTPSLLRILDLCTRIHPGKLFICLSLYLLSVCLLSICLLPVCLTSTYLSSVYLWLFKSASPGIAPEREGSVFVLMELSRLVGPEASSFLQAHSAAEGKARIRFFEFLSVSSSLPPPLFRACS